MISVNNRSRTVSAPAASPAVQPEARAEKQKVDYAPAYTEDGVTISPEARAAMARQAAAVEGPAEELPEVPEALPFPSFADAFSQVTEKYSSQIRDHYAKEHEENLTCDDPYVHVWNKYKNPESTNFRACLSEDERAWAYDQELDLLNDGKHLQMSNPYAFPQGAPTLESAAREANQACREQINQALQDILAKNGIELPKDAAFSLTVDETYTIHVTGLEDEELTAALEEALNRGENGKNLYSHLKVSVPEGGALSVDYKDGRLSPADTEQEWDDASLREVKKQAGPAWTRYSTLYDPHQRPMNDKILTLDPDFVHDQERFDRLCSAVRMGVREAIEEYYSTQKRTLKEQKFPAEDAPVEDTPVEDIPAENTPIAPVTANTLEGPVEIQPLSDADEAGAEETTFHSHLMAIINQLAAKQAIVEKYYAKQHAENMRFPNPNQHITDKYVNYRSPYFRSDLTEEERRICLEQERRCLYGGQLSVMSHDIALREDGGVSMVKVEINAINEVRSQVSQSVDDLIRESGITLPEGASFQLNVNPYDYYIHVEGLEDEELTRAIEQALNVGENGKRLYQHIEFSNPAGFEFFYSHLNLPAYSQYTNADVWKRSLYLTVEELTGYDIRTLERHDGTFWTPDGKDLWTVLCGADTTGKYDLREAHDAIFHQLARDGWDSTPDAWRGLIYRDGTLRQPDELLGKEKESDWQKRLWDEEDVKWAAFLAGREETLRKEAADRAAGITSCSYFGPRKPSEFTDEELLLRHPIDMKAGASLGFDSYRRGGRFLSVPANYRSPRL